MNNNFVVQKLAFIIAAFLFAAALGVSARAEESFQVSSDGGEYNVLVSYMPVPGGNSAIEYVFQIDGGESHRAVFSRLYDNTSGKPIEVRYGNETRSRSTEVFEWKTVTLGDSIKGPYLFSLDEGLHTVTFAAAKGEAQIQSVTIAKPEAAANYSEKGSRYAGDPITYQAERTEGGTLAVLKSSQSIRNETDYTSPDTVPYHAYEIRLNVIGGSSWRQAGEFISWEIDVPESGMYGLSFRAAQNMNRGVTSFRRLLVNGEVPFQQAEAFGFEFSTGYRQYDLTAGGQYIYLEKGANRITLENAIGEFALPLQTVEESMAALNALYRRTSQLTGLVPDQYIDYEIAKKIPDFSSIMKEQSEILGSTVDALVAMTGEKSDKTALVATMAQQAGRLALEPEDVVKELDFFKGNISALGDWIIAVTEMPLYVDSFTLYAPGETYSPKESGFLRKLWNSIVRFLATFFVDETKIGDDDPKKALKVWIPTGRDQAQILKSMSQDSQIPVEIQLIPLDVVLPAVLAGNGPDVSLDMPQATILNFAMRNALVPLSDKADYEKVFSGFFQSSIDAVTYSGKVYGAPERSWFPMMYARDDILSEIGIEPPKTWDEFRKAIVELNINNYEAYVPTGYSSMGMSGSSSGFTVFISMLCQKGGNLYNGFGENYGISTGLYSEEAMNAFADFTKFYTAYKLPVYADFANRFRTGEMPLGIYDYTLYNTLEVFAPEIRGLWSFAPLPGYVKEDGTIDNTVVAVGNYTAIMDSCKDKEAAWEFVKWWLSTETQTDYGLQMEAVLGGAGRYPTASKEVLASLPWSQSASKAILAQFENSVGIPEIPGGYMSYRMIDYAFRSVVTGTSAMSPRQALYLNLADIDKELDKKRAEFGLEVSGVPQ